MSVASDLIDKFHEEQNAAAEAPVETTQPVETTEPVVDNQPEPTPEEPKPEEPAVEPTEPSEPSEPSEPTPEPQKKEPKPDLSQLTKEQKAEHAFQKQLAKQKAKYESSVEEMKKSFQQQIDDLKKSMAPKPEPAPMKTRDDFDNDTDFVNYLAMRGVDQRLAEKAEADAKAQAEKEKADKEAAEAAARQQEVANYFNANAKKAFGDKYGEFEAKVTKGVANGLADVLDEAPAVRDFIFTNPQGPVLLDEILNSKESFVRVMSRAAHPMDAVIECHDLVKEVLARNAAVVEPNQPQKVMPNLGKPGAGSAPSTAPDMWKDDKSLIDFVRRHR